MEENHRRADDALEGALRHIKLALGYVDSARRRFSNVDFSPDVERAITDIECSLGRTSESLRSLLWELSLRGGKPEGSR